MPFKPRTLNPKSCMNSGPRQLLDSDGAAPILLGGLRILEMFRV